MLVKIYGKGRPVRMFVAGLHGNEWKDTSPVLLNLAGPSSGTLILVPLVDRGEYVSTLDSSYYSVIGRELLELIDRYRPDIYMELHSYCGENFGKLTSGERINSRGVPGFTPLEKGVLMGSVPPKLRLLPELIHSVCLSFEIRKADPVSRDIAVSVIELLKESRSGKDFIEAMAKLYPAQVRQARESYYRYYSF